MDIESITVDINRDECPICFETKETVYIDSFHFFCIDCILSIREPVLCPICRQPFF